MNWRNGRATVAQWCLAVATGAGVIAFIIPLLSAPTDQDPTGEAGFFAPVVALCVGAMVLAKAIHPRRRALRPIAGIFIGLGSMGSAYLWMVDASDVHPMDPAELPLALAILFGISIVILAVPLIVWSNSQSNGQSSSD